MIRYIHSLDIGCGSVSAFTGKYDPEHPETLPEPTPLTAEGGEPAICAVKQDGSYLVGDQLLQTDGDIYRDARNFEAGFLNVSDAEHRRRSVRYLRAWREYLQAKHPTAFPKEKEKEKDCEEYWVVGIPAGWRGESQVEAYRQTLLDAGYPNPILGPEANAAIYYAQRQFEAEFDMDKGVLCLDMGALSEKATFFTSEDAPFCELENGGAADAIGWLLLVENLQNAEVGKKYNDPSLVETLWAKWSCVDDGAFAEEVILGTLPYVQKLKEEYFQAYSQNGFVDGDLTIAVPLHGGGEKSFTLHVNDEMMDRILSTPQEEFGGKSWTGCFRAFLKERVAALSQDFTQAAQDASGQEESPPLILTGGGACMPFVEDIVLGVFPNAALYLSENPATAIAKGLWYMGSDRIKLEDLERAYQEVYTGTDQNGDAVLAGIWTEAYIKSWGEASQTMVMEAMNCLVSSTEGWADHQFKSNQIVPRARAAFKNWCTGQEVTINSEPEIEFFEEEEPADQEDEAEMWPVGGKLEELLEDNVAAAREHLADSLNKAFQDCLRESVLKDIQLFVPGDFLFEYPEKYLSPVLGALALNMDRVIASLAEEDSVYHPSCFPDLSYVDQILMGTSRKKHLSSVADALNQYHLRLGKKIGEEFQKILLDDKFYKYFVDECEENLIQAHSKRILALLGPVVVKDFIVPEEL